MLPTTRVTSPSEKLNWENPVPENGFKPHEWINHFIPHFDRMLVKIDEVGGDPLTNQEIQACYTILDLNPQPEDVAQANERLRLFVRAVRKVLGGHYKRRRHQAQLAQLRKMQQLASLMG